MTTPIPEIDFEKMDGLVPGIVQDNATGEVLMLGFLNESATPRPSKPASSPSGAAPARSSG
jgi:phosphoribosyl-AMP cyclohydrolase